MFGDLHIFVIDFDETDENSSFFKAAHALADKVTRSKSGGYHMFYGVNRQVAHPLFDSINLLAAQSAPSWVSRKAAWTNDRSNKVDMFCDALQLIYEFEEWDNSIGLTDKTQPLYELIRDNFELTKPIESCCKDAEGNEIALEWLSEEEMLSHMSDVQRLIFEDLKTMSSDCSQSEWFRTGIDIKHVFGGYNDDTDIDLGGSVWLWWSAQCAERFQSHSCANTWGAIINNDDATLWNYKWKAIIQDVAVFGLHSAIAELNEAEEERKAACNSYDIGALCPLEVPSVLSPNAAFEWIAAEGGKYLLSYDGTLYSGKAGFLSKKFDHYLETAYKVEYNTDNIDLISGNQCTRLSYHILDKKIGAKPISMEDDSILKLIAGSGNHEAAKRWLGRMNWENGNAKLISFGVGLEVRGAAKCVYCYRPEYYDNKATFAAEEMTWEQWSAKMIDALDSKWHNKDDIVMMMYYQNGLYMTLPIEEQKAIKAWIYKDYKLGEPFPYSGVIECCKSFEIDFDRDCKIVKSKSLRHNGNMAAHNRENATELAVARGKVRTKTAADADYEKIVGDEWTTAQLKEMLVGDYERKIRRLMDKGKIERVRRGLYRRKSC
jgi:hypothetical protein